MKPHNPNSISSRAEGTAPVVVLLVEDDRPLLELFTSSCRRITCGS